MSESPDPSKPLLRRHPDARKGRAPLLHPILLPYLALMFGSAVAGLAGTFNALMLRRTSLALKSLAIGAAGWLSFMLVVALVRKAGVENVAVAVVIGRVMHFALGGALYFVHRPHFRGHEFLNGKTAPLLGSYLVAILASMYMPAKLTLLLLGVPFVR